MDPITGKHFQTPQRIRADAPALQPPPLVVDSVEKGAKENLALIPPGLNVSRLREADDKSDAQALPRPMTNREKSEFKRYFPNLDVDKAVVTGEATPEYNCISWTVGETHDWFWPPSMYPDLTEEEAFDKFYGSYGFTPAPKGGVARWRNEDGLTHGCISGPDHGPRWESKCGATLRIQHDLNELEGETYGKVDGYYAKTGAPSTPVKTEPITLPTELLLGVAERANGVPTLVRRQFNTLHKEWMEFRQEPEVCISANPADYCRTEAFTKITKMGAGVIPLLMEKMAGGDFFCFQAVEAIRRRPLPHGISLPALTPEEQNNSEQNKAALMLLKWLNA